MAALVVGQRTTVLPTQTVPAGEYTTPVFDVPAGVTRIEASLDRNAWTDTGADVVAVTVEESRDGGDTWNLLVAFTSRGGVALDKAGNALARSYVIAPVTPGTKVRARATVAAPINTRIELVVS
jgi:hypothetical protein